MVYNSSPSPFAPNPNRAQSGDLAATITLLVLSVCAAGCATLFLLFALAFLDHCPPETCSTEAAELSVLIGQAFILLSVIAGITISVWRLVKKKTAWWIALFTLVAIVIGAIAGFIAFVIIAGAY